MAWLLTVALAVMVLFGLLWALRLLACWRFLRTVNLNTLYLRQHFSGPSDAELMQLMR
jgi:hypothetical protein